MAAIAKRLEYERELIQIVEERSDYFGQRGTHSQGIDVLFFKGSGLDFKSFCIMGEVKTSGSHKINITGKVKEQYERYMNLWNNHRVLTYYFFRLLTSKQYYQYKSMHKELEVNIFRQGFREDKWRVFRIDELPLNRNNNPFLDFFNSNGMKLDEFLEMIE
jgi:hypothetical protein